MEIRIFGFVIVSTLLYTLISIKRSQIKKEIESHQCDDDAELYDMDFKGHWDDKNKY